MIRETSLKAYRGLPLQQRERDVMTACHRHFPLPARFTRKQLAEAMGWEINRITGRVLTLLERGYLTEYPQTRDGGHLLSVAPSKTQERGHGSAPLSASHNSGGGAVTPAAGPDDQSPGAAFDQGPSRRMGQQSTAAPASVNSPADTPSASLSAAAVPDEQLIHDSLGRPFYTAVGWGPGYPLDQEHLYRRKREKA